LLENAIYHGIERLPNGGEVLVTATVDEKTIRLAVDNPVADNVQTVDSRAGDREGNKLALDNIKQRLQLFWPDQSNVLVENPPGRYRVTLTFPYSKREQQ